MFSSLEGFGHIYLIQGLSEPPQPSEISHFLSSGFDSVRGLLSANSCQVSKRFCNNNWTSRTLDYVSHMWGYPDTFCSPIIFKYLKLIMLINLNFHLCLPVDFALLRHCCNTCHNSLYDSTVWTLRVLRQFLTLRKCKKNVKICQKKI